MTMSGQDRQDRVASQVVIVTGGGGVIGGAIDAAFGRAGALVAVADLAAEALADTVANIAQGGGHALGIEVDVTKPRQRMGYA